MKIYVCLKSIYIYIYIYIYICIRVLCIGNCIGEFLLVCCPLWIKSDQNEIQQIQTHLERSSWTPSQFCFTGCNSLDFWVSSVWLWITGSRPSINHPPLFWSMEPCVHGTLQLVVTREITLVSFSHSKNRGRTFWLLAWYKRKGFY